MESLFVPLSWEWRAGLQQGPMTSLAPEDSLWLRGEQIASCSDPGSDGGGLEGSGHRGGAEQWSDPGYIWAQQNLLTHQTWVGENKRKLPLVTGFADASRGGALCPKPSQLRAHGGLSEIFGE